MTVREAIDQLSKLDPDLKLYAIDGAESWSEVETFEVNDKGAAYDAPKGIMAAYVCPW